MSRMSSSEWRRIECRLFLSAAALVGIAALPLGSSAIACSCAHPASAQEFVEEWADVIFLGTVSHSNLGPEGKDRSKYFTGGDKVVFQVIENLKAADSKEIVLRVIADDWACGFPFALGKSYYVAARKQNSELTTGYCLMMPLYGYRDEILGELNK